MKRGRPAKSVIRDNMIQLLSELGEMYAYKLHQLYVERFSPVTMRSIYYHLKKGLLLDEFRVSKIVKEEGQYSWGPSAEKIYYALGKNAQLQR